MRRMTYQEQLKDVRWQRRRLEIFQAFGYRCEDCGVQSDLQIHHCHYDPGLMAWEYPNELLMVVCDGCHVKRFQLENSVKREISKRMRFLKPAQLEKGAWELFEVVIKGTEYAACFGGDK